ncbi:Fibronectin type-III domain-containing protein [Desulfarculales bacterium]
MAPTRMTLVRLGLILASTVLLLGCGIKSAPLPTTQAAPPPPTDLVARAVENGVEISFTVPPAGQIDKQVVEAWLHYAYLPRDGDPDCPPCSPHLRRHYELNLAKQLSRLEGGRFTYVDTQALMEHQAVYQVNLVDARGRAGVVSPLVRALRVDLPATPRGLIAHLADRQVGLSWQPVETLDNGQPTGDKIGYILYRKDGVVVRALNERPMIQTGFLDRSVAPGQTYEYQVAAARLIANYVVVGQRGPWVQATTQSMQPPSPPEGLVGGSLENGIYLRLTPSLQQDIAGYNIMRASAKQGPWIQINPDLNRGNTFVDKDVKLGSTYFYRVVAVNDGGLASQPSETVEVHQQP